MNSRRKSRCSSPVARHVASAFTLIELTVVISIMLVLTLLVVMVFNANAGSDRLRSAARVAQSAFRGAVDRALHAKQPRGIRLLRDAQDPSLVIGFVYLQPLETLSYGSASGSAMRLLRPDADNDGLGTDATDPNVTIVEAAFPASMNTDWLSLANSGLLPFPSRIRLPAGPGGQWYTFTNVRAGYTAGTQLLDLTAPFTGTVALFPQVEAVASSNPQATCEIELGSELLPGHQPISLSSGTVIDLDWSGRNDFVPPGIPGTNTAATAWPAGPGTPVNIDLLFSPRGTAHGALTARGPIHLLLNDLGDATQDLNPIDAKNRGEKLVLTLFPQTGNVATFPIDPTDADNDGFADDLFRFAKQGSEAGR
jgi:type II secretory pathway pseudopilin PulG